MQVLDSLRRRLHAVDPFKLDIAIAAVFVVAAAIELYHLDAEGHSRPVTIVAGAIAMASLALRRRNPLAATVLFGAPAVVQAFLDGYLTENATTPFVGLLFLLYSIGRYADTRRLRDALLVLVPSMVLTLTFEVGWDGPADLVWLTFLFGLPVLAGRVLRGRLLLQAELREKAELAEHDREERAHAAVEHERVRIATELQELVANGLSTMVVQAGAVPRAVAAGDTVRAGTALAAVETTGREALTEMRTLMGVLRRDGDAAELAPQPGLARLEALAKRSSARGLAVTLDLQGWRRPLPAGVDLTAYRVVEDALDAATEQGAERAEVLVRYRPRALQLQVTNDRAAGEPGRLAGLRDRVGLYGGHLRTEWTGERTFRVRATLPLEQEES